MANEAMLTTKEVAEYFQVEPRTVTRWVRLGLLPCMRIKRFGIIGRPTLRFRRQDLDRLYALSEGGGGPGLGRAARNGGRGDPSMG